jgi:hypothetical protein
VRLPPMVLSDSLVLARVLYDHVTGRKRANGAFRAIPFKPGGDDATAATRRALVIGAISLTPNTYVVGIDTQADLILVHQLAAAEKASARRDVLGRL